MRFNDFKASLVALPAMRETWVQSPGQEDSLEKGMVTHSTLVFQPGEFHGQKSLVGCTVHRVAQSTELDTTEVTQQHFFFFATQSVDPGLATLTSWSLLEMQNLGPYPRYSESESALKNILDSCCFGDRKYC